MINTNFIVWLQRAENIYISIYLLYLHGALKGLRVRTVQKYLLKYMSCGCPQIDISHKNYKSSATL